MLFRLQLHLFQQNPFPSLLFHANSTLHSRFPHYSSPRPKAETPTTFSRLQAAASVPVYSLCSTLPIPAALQSGIPFSRKQASIPFSPNRSPPHLLLSPSSPSQKTAAKQLLFSPSAGTRATLLHPAFKATTLLPSPSRSPLRSSRSPPLPSSLLLSHIPSTELSPSPVQQKPKASSPHSPDLMPYPSKTAPSLSRNRKLRHSPFFPTQQLRSPCNSQQTASRTSSGSSKACCVSFLLLNTRALHCSPPSTPNSSIPVFQLLLPETPSPFCVRKSTRTTTVLDFPASTQGSQPTIHSFLFLHRLHTEVKKMHV